MLLFIEGYPYKLNDVVRDGLSVRDILKDVVAVPQKEETYSSEYVGYCYSKAAQDVIFFLPKVVLTGEQNEESGADTIFGASPQEIIDFESDTLKSKFSEEGCKEYKEFLSSLSIWVYRTISVYKQTHNDNILESKEYLVESSGRKRKHNTLLDVIIALRDFNKENQDYFTFIAKTTHSGYNKIQWQKTIARKQPFITDGVPVYLDPVNKKKSINFDEELLIIYFSILNYIRDIHGFSFEINIGYHLISPKQIKEHYIGRNMGCRRLKQIKYKYFSDKALRIWDLCYAFFDREYKIAMNRQSEDYLLAKNFEHIFEVMIDSLISGNDKKDLPKELTDQKDGKLVDHLFIGKGLIEQSDLPAELTYYIGDSKYYKRAKDDRVLVGDKSIYKQYTYAKNIIQWNMNLFLDGSDLQGQPQLRDTLTEGYNPIPNFFISARIPNKQDTGKFLSFDDGNLKTQHDKVQMNRQFENRLFDRDTLLLCHYDVNFLFIVSLYGRDNKGKQAAWRDYVRKEFRTRIQDTLNSLYTFRTLQPREGMNCNAFIQENFRQLNGKLYRPRVDCNYLILALMKGTDAGLQEWKKLNIKAKVVSQETEDNEELLNSLQSHFYVSEAFELDRELIVEHRSGVGTLKQMPKSVGDGGVLMVVMPELEKYLPKFQNGKIAVALYMTPESMKILENIQSIGFILFHNREDKGQHLFALTSNCTVHPQSMKDSKDVYCNILNGEMYVVAEFDPKAELDSSNIKSSRAPFNKESRYESQFARLKEIMRGQ